MSGKKERILLILLRLSMGFMLFWTFLDKLFGFGFSTTANKSWLAGISPAEGFLKTAVKGPFASFYQSLAGNPFVDWLFMIGLFLIGLALLLGIGMKIASFTGALLMLLMWTAMLPPKNNPILDEHIIYLLLFLSFTTAKTGRRFGLGGWWAKTKLVKQYPFLE